MNLVEKLQHKYALSEKGAKDMIKAFVAVSVSNVALMFPAGIMYSLICDLIYNNVGKDRYPFYIIGSVVCLLFIAVTTYIQYNVTYLYTYEESGIRRTALAEKLRKLPLSYFGKKDLSDLTNTIMNDCAQLETASSHWYPELIGSMISTALISVGLFFIDWRMALAALWVLPIAFAIVLSSSGLQKKIGRKHTQLKLDSADGIQECLESIRDLRSNNAREAYMTELTRKLKAVEKHSLVIEVAVAFFVSSSQMILKVGIATVTLVGSFLIVDGSIDMLTFFLFLLVVSRLYDPFQVALQNLAVVIASEVQCERMDEILSHGVQRGKEELTNEGYDIVFENVGFSYEDGEKVLEDVSFEAHQGQVTALIGPSGGGKTTVSRLAARFWDIPKGRITMGGMDISDIDPEKLLSLYSIVFQNVTLFNNSIMENIRIGKKDATDEAVLAAAKLANCDEFALKLEKGYYTEIGENGCELSGGERQRISIARAFLKDAPIILLDEATASLDVDNETLIQEALSKLIKEKTVLIIAHRMRTIANADKIVVLKDGVVAEQGTPEELNSKNGIYANMLKLQMKSSEWKM